MMKIFARARCLNITIKLWMLQLRIRKRTVFWPLGFDFTSVVK